MKNALVILSMCLLLTSCSWTYVNLSNINSSDYKNYICQCYSQTDSPIGYPVVSGENPASAYDWLTVRISDYEPKMFNYMCFTGNKDDLIKAAYPKADSILYYNGTYSVGTLKDKKEK